MQQCIRCCSQQCHQLQEMQAVTQEKLAMMAFTLALNLPPRPGTMKLM
jgi:hypothetical protein